MSGNAFYRADSEAVTHHEASTLHLGVVQGRKHGGFRVRGDVDRVHIPRVHVQSARARIKMRKRAFWVTRHLEPVLFAEHEKHFQYVQRIDVGRSGRLRYRLSRWNGIARRSVHDALQTRHHGSAPRITSSGFHTRLV